MSRSPKRDWLGRISMVVLLACAGCGPVGDGSGPVPEGLLGVWVTEASEMSDRAFEITPEQIFFQIGPDSYTLHSIRGVVQVSTGDESDIDVEYVGLSNQVQHFRLSTRGSGIVMRNRPEVWWYPNRDPSRDWPWRTPAGA